MAVEELKRVSEVPVIKREKDLLSSRQKKKVKPQDGDKKKEENKIDIRV